VLNESLDRGGQLYLLAVPHHAPALSSARTSYCEAHGSGTSWQEEAM
jgi:hypothetical protein